MAPSHPGLAGAEAVLCPTAPQDGQEMTSSERGTKRKRKVLLQELPSLCPKFTDQMSSPSLGKNEREGGVQLESQGEPPPLGV